jgi:uncharacterized protein (DUF2141 family)
MKKLFIIALTSFTFSFNSYCQLRLEIEISGIRNTNGVIMLQLLDEKENIVTRAKGTIFNNESTIIFSDLKPGKYAFRYFHDEDLSGIMETGALGIPEEGYGFSNNAYGMFGPKHFSEWLFELKDDKKVAVKIKYHGKN